MTSDQIRTPIQLVVAGVRQVAEARSVGLHEEEAAMKRLESALAAWERDILRSARAQPPMMY